MMWVFWEVLPPVFVSSQAVRKAGSARLQTMPGEGIIF